MDISTAVVRCMQQRTRNKESESSSQKMSDDLYDSSDVLNINTPYALVKDQTDTFRNLKGQAGHITFVGLKHQY
jgi:hypothetical protein